MNKKNLFIIIISMLILSCITASASFTNEWEEYQDDPSNRGFVHDDIGIWNSVGAVLTRNIGNDFQPIILDWDDDSSNDVISFSTTFITVLNENLETKDTLNIVKTPLSQPTFYLNGTSELLAIIVSNELRIYDYNGTDIFLVNSTSINTTGTKVTGVKYSNSFIYFAASMNATQSNFYKIRGNNFTIINTTTFSGNVTHNPAIGDIDLDTIDEIVIVCDNNNNGEYGLCVFDADLGNFDVGFNNSGILDDLHTKGGDTYVTSPLIYNLDDATDREIIFARSVEGTCGGVAFNYLPTITAYNSDGTTLWSRTGNTGTVFPGCPNSAHDPFWITQPFIAFDDAGNDLVCAVGNGDTNNEIWEHMGCLNGLNGTIEWSTINPLVNVNVIDKGITSGGAFLRTTGDDYLVFGQFIYFSNGTFAINITQVDASYEYAIVDLDTDNNLDIVYSTLAIIKAIFSDFTNLPPVVNNTYAYGGYGGQPSYESPICVNTTLTFSARECTDGVSCNYDNDVASDTERIVSNCGQLPSGAAGTSFTANLDNGTLDANNPQFQCVYNLTGIFSVRLFLQDQADLFDFSEYNTQAITVNVIDGTPGITCNLIPSVSPGDTTPIPASAQESQTNAAIEDTLGILFGSGTGSDKLKLIVGIALILGIIAAAYREGVKDAAGIAIVAGLATLLVTFIGLITPAIFILALALIIFVIFLGRSLTGGAPQGGG